MLKNIFALLLIVFALSSCSKTESSVSSTRAAKIIDQSLATELQSQRENATEEINQVDSRATELMMILNDLYTNDNPTIREKYGEVMAAQVEFIQSKSHYEMERSMFVDKMLNLAAEVSSRDQFKEDASKMIEELRRQGDMYMNATRNLLQAMKNAGVENPMLEEMLAPAPPREGDHAEEVHN